MWSPSTQLQLNRKTVDNYLASNYSRGMAKKKITKATAKAAVRKNAGYLLGMTHTGWGGNQYPLVNVTSQEITVWMRDPASGDELEERAVKNIAAAMGVGYDGNGSRFWIYYKEQPAPMGDYNDKASHWHY